MEKTDQALAEMLEKLNTALSGLAPQAQEAVLSAVSTNGIAGTIEFVIVAVLSVPCVLIGMWMFRKCSEFEGDFSKAGRQIVCDIAGGIFVVLGVIFSIATVSSVSSLVGSITAINHPDVYLAHQVLQKVL